MAPSLPSWQYEFFAYGHLSEHSIGGGVDGGEGGCGGGESGSGEGGSGEGGGGDDGGGGGKGGGGKGGKYSRGPQSSQSVPSLHCAPAAPTCPSWQTPLPAYCEPPFPKRLRQVFSQSIGGGGGGEGGGNL